MATADEILATMSEETTQSVIVINNDLRTINIPESIKILGVESDDDVLRLHFRMPKMYGEVDLSEFAIRINYMNAKEKGDVYAVSDAAVDGEYIAFSWLVGRTATEYRGNVQFIVCLKRSENGVVMQEYNTTVATLKVLEGLETGEAIVARYPDIIESMLLRLDALEKGGSTGGGSNIDDTTPSATTTYSSQKIEAELKTQKEAIDAKGDPTDEQVSAAVNDYLDANPVSGGINTTAKNLLITILRSGVYTDDQSDNITALETALGSGTTEPEEPDVPVDKTYAISNELINCISSNSAESVKENAAYSATLTANDGYTLTGGTVTVTMGGVDITATAYADGVISIAAVTGDVEIFASAVESESGGDDGGSLIHSFDFTQGLSDSVGELTATVNGSATQDSDGVHLTTVTDYVGLGGLETATNRAYEIDIGTMERIGTAHGRLLAQDGAAGFMYRSTGYWTWWSANGWCESTGITGFADLANKTVRLEVDEAGYQTLYVDGSKIAKSSLAVTKGSGPTGAPLENLVMTLGSSSGSSAANSVIKAFRVYNMEVVA